MVTAERLRELMHYEPETGVFTRLKRTSNRVKVGDVAGTLTTNGYIEISVDGSKHYGHRLAWLYMTGTSPSYEIDHIDGCTSRNSWKNLRPATHKQNIENHKIRTDNTSGVNGVHWDSTRLRWVPSIIHHGESIYLGRFRQKKQAIAARREAERKYFTHSKLTS